MLLDHEGFLQEHQPCRQRVWSIPTLCIPHSIPAASKEHGEPSGDHPVRENPRDGLEMLRVSCLRPLALTCS